MAQLLVFLRNNTHDDPDKEKRGCFKRGDIVAVFDDLHIFGALEGPPDFQIVQVPGVDPSNFCSYLSSTEFRRDFSFDIDSIQPMSLRMMSEGEPEIEPVIVVEPEQVESLITDKRS